jgi:Arc/MetJ family transcription regulator
MKIPIAKDDNIIYFIINLIGEKMRITLDIDASRLAQIQRLTGIRKQSPAVREALEQYVREVERKKFLRKVLDGKTDYSLSNDDLEALGDYDAD